MDYLLFLYTFNASVITDVCEKMMLQAWVISSVQTDKFDSNDINVILQQGYEQGKDETRVEFETRLKAIRADVLKELSDDKVRKEVIRRRAEKEIELLGF